MSLEQLKEAIHREVDHWAKSHGLPAPAELTFNQAPAHVSAELSLPWPLQAAKAAKKNPMDLARSLASDLASKIPGVDSVEPYAPGFVNLHLTTQFLCENLRGILSNPSAYGAKTRAAKRSILIEFVSANPTGPLHLASGRAASLGDSLARILKRIGHKVGTEYYVNDAGRQVELLGETVFAKTQTMLGNPKEPPAEGYKGLYIGDISEAALSKHGKDAVMHWTPKQHGEYAINYDLELHKKDMEDFGVHFDRWFRESELHKAKAVESTLQWLKEHGMAYEHDGATWLGSSSVLGKKDAAEEAAETDDKDRVLVKSDGRPTYFLADIAYHKDKFDRGWEKLIDIWGADHHGYVPRMKAAVSALGHDPGSFHVIIHQLVHLYRGKELVKMSKRAGEFVTLRELLSEVGRDACRFFFAMRGPNVHMNFDLELAKKQSQENPVYYVQYVHARIRSIFREGAKAGMASETSAGAASLLGHPSERALLIKLAWLPDTLSACETALSPHPLSTYLMELAGLFHTFYEQCRVVDPENKPLSQARLGLCAGIAAVIKEGLDLLGVSAPEHM